MKFFTDEVHYEDGEPYLQYLKSIAPSLPPGAREFALAKWHYDHDDHRCPHDAWVEKLTLEETATGDRHQVRRVQASVLLLGAFHDGFLSIEYLGVRDFSCHLSIVVRDTGFGDWLVDEISVGEEGFVIHEVRFSTGASYLIEFEDMQCRWSPAGGPPVRIGDDP